MPQPPRPPDEPVDPDDDLDDPASALPEGFGSFVRDSVKKVAVAGLGALFMTEEGIRNLAGQLKVPKEMLGFILTQAEKTKSEIGRVVSEEVRGFLQSEKLREEFLKLLTGMTVEIKAEVRLIPSEGEGKGEQVKLSVSELGARRQKKASAPKKE